jgi:hypothetical protein
MTKKPLPKDFPDFHTFPHLDATDPDARMDWTGGAPRCPKCGHGQHGLHVVFYRGYAMVRCILCGWQETREKSDERRREATRTDVTARDVQGGETIKRTRQPWSDLSEFCVKCGVNSRDGGSVYCAPCRAENKKEAMVRFWRKKNGLSIPEPGLVDDVIFELTECILVCVG